MKKFLLLLLIIFFPITAVTQVELVYNSESLSPKCRQLVEDLNEELKMEIRNSRSSINPKEFGNKIAQKYIKSGVVSDLSVDDLMNTCLYNFSRFKNNDDYKLTEYKTADIYMKEKKFMPMVDKYLEIDYVISEFVKIESCNDEGEISNNQMASISCKDYMEYFNSAIKTIARYNGIHYSTVDKENVVQTLIVKE